MHQRPEVTVTAAQTGSQADAFATPWMGGGAASARIYQVPAVWAVSWRKPHCAGTMEISQRCWLLTAGALQQNRVRSKTFVSRHVFCILTKKLWGVAKSLTSRTPVVRIFTFFMPTEPAAAADHSLHRSCTVHTNNHWCEPDFLLEIKSEKQILILEWKH